MENTDKIPRVAESLSEIIKFKTVADKSDKNKEEFCKLHAYMESRYPHVFSSLERIKFGHSLLLWWRGSDSRQLTRPTLLMAHMDVVEAVGAWEHSPYAGELYNNAVFGRGAVDTKGSLVSIFESLENLIISEFVPKNDIYILSTASEEIAGEDGAKISEYFEEKNIRFSLCLDEGGAIMREPIAGVEGEFAMIALAERRSVKLRFVACGADRMERIAKFILAMKKQKFVKGAFSEIVLKMFETLTPHMSGFLKFLFRHFAIFSPLIKFALPKMSDEAKAMLMPTASFSTPLDCERSDLMVNEACITLTIMSTYEMDSDTCVKKIIELGKSYGLAGEVIVNRETVKPEKVDSDGYKLVTDTVREVFSDVEPCPFTLFGGTDSRHFAKISDSVIRFAPLKLTKQQFGSFHKNNENINISSLVEAVEFYTALIKKI